MGKGHPLGEDVRTLVLVPRNKNLLEERPWKPTKGSHRLSPSPGLWGMKQIAHGAHKKLFVLMLAGFLDTMWVLIRGLGNPLRLPAPSPRENIEKGNIVQENFENK